MNWNLSDWSKESERLNWENTCGIENLFILDGMKDQEDYLVVTFDGARIKTQMAYFDLDEAVESYRKFKIDKTYLEVWMDTVKNDQVTREKWHPEETADSLFGLLQEKVPKEMKNRE